MGTGTLEEALHWIEYCNGTGDTYVSIFFSSFLIFNFNLLFYFDLAIMPTSDANTQAATNPTTSNTGV